MTDYLHGVETIETEIGGQTMTVVKSSVVALLGIAPVGPTNILTLCNNSKDDAIFGATIPGFNIPKTLKIIRSIGGASPILVINVFNPLVHCTSVDKEQQTITDGKAKLTYSPIGEVTIYQQDGDSLAPYVLNQDYTINAFGQIQVISNGIADSTVLKFTYKRLNDSAISSTQLIGGIDTVGNRTGLALLDIAFNNYGFTPKVLISPTYSALSSITEAMASAAKKFRAIYLVDAPYGLSLKDAIKGRGPSSGLVFNTADERAILLYPHLKTWDDYLQADDDYPYSAFLAGVIIATDAELGYWYSPSNKAISAATGFERSIEWAINDAACEANQLNSVGIMTIAAGFGTGILTWGNRNASFPSKSSVKNFTAIRRADDMVTESMELAALPFLDLPMTMATIDSIREAGNSVIRTLVQRGAFLPGSRVEFFKADNLATDLAAGKIVFQRTYMVPPPIERLTYKDVLDISLLNNYNFSE